MPAHPGKATGITAPATLEAGAPAAARTAKSLALLLLVVAVGAALSLQSFLNGRLGARLGSAELAAGVNNAVALACVALIGTITGVPARAFRHLASAQRLRWWHMLAGINGALFLTVAAYAAARVGIALLTVAVVCGQTLGSVGVDLAGLSPAGRRPLTTFRLLGVAFALTAVGLAALESSGDVQISGRCG